MVRHSLLPATVGASVEVPAEIFQYMPGVWDTDRIRESIAAYLVSRGQNLDSFRFFPTIYDNGLRHANYAGTYPRQKSVTAVRDRFRRAPNATATTAPSSQPSVNRSPAKRRRRSRSRTNWGTNARCTRTTKTSTVS